MTEKLTRILRILDTNSHLRKYLILRKEIHSFHLLLERSIDTDSVGAVIKINVKLQEFHENDSDMIGISI